MNNSRFPHKDERWIVDARRNRSMACSLATMALMGIIFTLGPLAGILAGVTALLSGCTAQSTASSPASDSALPAAASATVPARSDYKSDDRQLDASQSEYSRYILG